MEHTTCFRLRGISLLLLCLTFSIFSHAQTSGFFIGKVVDQQGMPVIGVSVRPVDAKQGVVTNVDGEFRFEAKGQEKRDFIFSYLGMKSVTETLRDGLLKIVVMEDDSKAIEEVVVTGYQNLSRRESAAAISTVKMKDVFTPSAMSLDQMLQGKIPGMSVMLQSGEPSSTPVIRIRGNSTINGNKAPVWVVDGVIMSETVPFSVSDLNSPDASYLIGNSISGLSPQDIESISVLKDASATAIYGVKAANGVIVVTTKKGRAMAPTITYDMNLNMSTRPTYGMFDLMNSQERVQLSKDIYDARLQYPRVPTDESYEGALQRYLKRKITHEQFASEVQRYETMNTNWFKHLFRETLSQSHNVSLNGGTSRVHYYASLSYNDAPGIAKGSESNRFTGLSKVFVKINRIFDVDVKFDLSNQTNEGFYGVNPFSYAFNTSRSLPLYNHDELYYYSKSSFSNEIDFNILNELATTGMETNIRRLGGLINLNAHLLNGLKYTSTFSSYWGNTRSKKFANEHSYEVGKARGYNYGAYDRGSTQFDNSPLPVGGILNEANTSKHSYSWRNTLNYIQVYSDKHEINLFGGIEIRSDKYSGSSQLSYGWDPTYGQSVSPAYTKRYNALMVGGMFNPRLTDRVTQIASYFGTASYTFDNRYVFNANIRSDGANKFGSNPKYRWLPTWSVAGKWFISNETFMKNVKMIDNLSIRASYGLQGNIHDDSSPYLIAQMGRIDDITGLRSGYIRHLPNPDLRWEKTRSYNIGLDASFWQRRLTFTVDYYKKKTSDLITDMQVSPSTGRLFMFMNAGEAINEGLEGVISLDAIRNKNVEWNVSYNFSHNSNEVRYAYDAALSEKETYEAMLRGNVATIGQPLGTIYSFRFAGLSPDNGYPLFYTKDGRKVHEGDYQVMELVASGSIYPRLSGGFDTRLTFKKNLSLSVGFSYQLGGKRRLPSIYKDASKAFDPTQNVSTLFNNRWRSKGDETKTDIPALYDTRIADDFPEELKGLYDIGRDVDVRMVSMYDNSDIRVASSDFLRLRNVMLSYRLPEAWLKSINVKAMTLRMTASNLKIWKSKKWEGMDPETAYANMPLMPSFNFGVNILF